MTLLTHGRSLAPSCGIVRSIVTNAGTHLRDKLFPVSIIETAPTNISTSSILELPSIPQCDQEYHSIPTCNQQEVIM